LRRLREYEGQTRKVLAEPAAWRAMPPLNSSVLLQRRWFQESVRLTQVNDLQRSRVWSEVVRPAPIGRSRVSARPE
jgi:hypothetical protein